MRQGKWYNIDVPTKELLMHIITTPVGDITFPSDQLIAALAFVKYLRSQNIEYTHIFED